MGGFTPAPRPEPTMISRTRGPEDVHAQRVIADVADEILLYHPEATPFTTITGKLRDKKVATQRKYDFFEKDEQPRRVTVLNAATAGTATLVLKAGDGLKVGTGYVLMNLNTREQVQATAIATDTLTVTRGLGGIQEAMAAGDPMEFQAMIAADGAGIGPLKSIAEDNIWNYCEIVRTAYGFTGRQKVTSMYGGKDPATERRWQAIEHAKSLEYRFLFGRRHLVAGSGQTHDTTYTGGMEYFIRTNVWDLDGKIPTEAQFVDFLEEAMRLGNNGNENGQGRKWLFASRRWLTIIERYARDKIEYRPLDKQVGIQVGRFVTSHGVIMLVPTPILTGTVHGGYAFLADLDHVRYRHMAQRDTKLLEGRAANDVDGEQEEYLTDFGAQIELEASHAILKGLPLAG